MGHAEHGVSQSQKDMHPFRMPRSKSSTLVNLVSSATASSPRLPLCCCGVLSDARNWVTDEEHAEQSSALQPDERVELQLQH